MIPLYNYEYIFMPTTMTEYESYGWRNSLQYSPCIEYYEISQYCQTTLYMAEMSLACTFLKTFQKLTDGNTHEFIRGTLLNHCLNELLSCTHLMNSRWQVPSDTLVIHIVWVCIFTLPWVHIAYNPTELCVNMTKYKS